MNRICSRKVRIWGRAGMAFAKDNCDSGICRSCPEIQEALGVSKDTLEGPLWKVLKEIKLPWEKSLGLGIAEELEDRSQVLIS